MTRFLGFALLLSACSAPDNMNSGTTGGGNVDLGGPSSLPDGGGQTALGGVTFPWGVWDGTTPDVPASSTGNTIYVDAKNGMDANDGSSIDKAKATLGAAIQNANAGDTILLAGGIYRERPDYGGLSGSASKPITIGSYGHGTGAPILDGGVKPKTWTKYSAQGQTTVWQTSATQSEFNNTPVLGIYVDSGQGEYALKEVPHGQLQSYNGEPLPPNLTQTGIIDNSGNWYYDSSAKILYADFGSTIGTNDPNNADVSLLFSSKDNHAPLIVLTSGHDYLSFIGLTVRASSWHAVYSEASHITFDHCDMKFNGGGGIFFGAGVGDNGVTDNRVLNTRIWMNVLDNWPRFNNGNTGGGWPGSLSWYSQSNLVAQGNVVYGNGGEGLIVWGTGAGHTAMNNHVRHNVIYDNFSVNLYCDNTQNAVIEENFVFDHARDPSTTFATLLTVSPGYDQDFAKRMTPVCLSLADEPGSADDGQAHLANITVINNIFAGKFGFVDYDDGTGGHGLKGCVVANNTWVLATQAVPGQAGYGWRHGFTGDHDASMNSIVQNNLIVTAVPGDHFVEDGAGMSGVTVDNNQYSGPGGFTVADAPEDFSTWKGSGWDAHSAASDAKIGDAGEFSSAKAVFDWAKSRPGAAASGADLSSRFSTDFTGAARAAWNTGAL